MLKLKKINYDNISLNELSPELNSERFRKINPIGILPALYINDQFLTESMAISEYLEECHPEVIIFF